MPTAGPNKVGFQPRSTPAERRADLDLRRQIEALNARLTIAEALLVERTAIDGVSGLTAAANWTLGNNSALFKIDLGYITMAFLRVNIANNTGAPAVAVVQMGTLPVGFRPLSDADTVAWNQTPEGATRTRLRASDGAILLSSQPGGNLTNTDSNRIRAWYRVS